jgi:hypothetical protein
MTAIVGGVDYAKQAVNWKREWKSLSERPDALSTITKKEF